MNKCVELQDLGNKDYKQSWDYQEQLFKGIVDTKIKNQNRFISFYKGIWEYRVC